jgi:hypothetical protein
MSITLDTPEQISMWVLISRRHQVQLHLKGLKVKSIMAALKRDFGDHGNRVTNYIVPIEYAISEAGGEVDYSLVNVHVMLSRGGMFFDRGVYDSTDAALATHPEFGEQFAKGNLEVVLTTDEPRPMTNEIFLPA